MAKQPSKGKRPVEAGPRLWTSDKAALIDEYLHLFLLLTKHGVYLDLFAGPQNDRLEDWSVRRVLERRTQGPAIRRYAVCDSSLEQAEKLRELGDGRPEATFKVYQGDANVLVPDMLNWANIGPRTACFCLIDQRTFECDWTTVETIARFKQEGLKIEMFYFLAQGWIDRAWASVKDARRLEAWWGGADYERFHRLGAVHRAHRLCERFRDELGYAFAEPFSIHEKGEGSRTMYYMIHASDHPDANNLMSRAYREVSRRRLGDRESLRLPGME